MEDKKKVSKFEELANKWLNNTIKAKERDEFTYWYNEGQDERLEIPEHIAIDEEIHKQKMYNSIKESINSKKIKKPVSWIKLSAAAVIIILGVSLFFFNSHQSSQKQYLAKKNQKIVPGGNKAFLTLSNGEVILLDDQKNGEISQQAGVKVSKMSDGQLLYSVEPEKILQAKKLNIAAYNTIETPNGGQYRIVLPDGTKIWLNAASTLRYPIYFSAKNRTVELDGEAYFEVSKDKERPFIVNTSKQQVEVLGTHFNINTYQNEESVKTTLLEGAVKVTQLSAKSANKTLILVPGEQAVLAGSNLNVKNVDVEQVIAWKNGFFQFSHSDLKSVMRQVSRWYNIDIVYDGKTPAKEFSGKIERNVTANELVEALNFSGIRCEIKDAKIIVKL